MNRIFSVVRMQFVNTQTYLWIPLMVLGGAFVISLAIWGIVTQATNGVEITLYTGGAQAPMWYFLVVGVQALTLAFPFSQAMSVTRREFYLGTLLTAAITSAGLAVIYVVMGIVEIATGGWGMNASFFALQPLWDSASPLLMGLFFFVLSLLFFVIGFWAASLYKRFGATWLTIILVGLGLLMVGAVWIITRANAWAQLGTWFGSLGVGGTTLLMAVIGAALALIAFPTLRRTLP